MANASEPDPRTPLTYQAAGLDLNVYEQTLAGIAPFLRRTHTPRVLDGFGGSAIAAIEGLISRHAPRPATRRHCEY